MGCLNSNQGFRHWFGNIHLSGPCNRECYFCIGQHMMALDALNTLDTWPLPGLDNFVTECRRHGVTEVNLTGTNTDPLLFKHHAKLTAYIRKTIPGVSLGIRTNGALITSKPDIWRLYDKASITLPSFDQAVYLKQMGKGTVPDIKTILGMGGPIPKVNIVLGPENRCDITDTLSHLAKLGIRKVNLREPYGQPHVGNPLEKLVARAGTVFGMPMYNWCGVNVVYWDVHYVHVESINLYAQGRVSVTYPITKGHDESGTVFGQDHWKERGRHREQWVL